MERKEAIEVIKKNWPDSSFTMLREALETLIPELKESEDERIRKKFINALKECSFTHFNVEFTVQEALAWLEKQGDQKSAAWSEEDERIKNNLLSELTNLSVRKLIEKETEKKYASWLKSLRPQSQWKPSEEHYELEEFAKIVRGNLTGISKAVQKLFEAKYLQLTGNKMYGGFKD